MEKIVAIIQARQTSTRLPNKMLMPIYKKMTALEIMVHRLKLSKLLDDIVIAIPDNKSNNELYKLVKNIKDITVFRGSENNVLERVYFAAKEQYNILPLNIYDSKKNDIVIVDLTGDCPFIDPYILDDMINEYLYKQYDYYSNTITRSYPDGMDIQIYPFSIFKFLYEKIYWKTIQHRYHTGWNILHYSSELNFFMSSHLKLCNHSCPNILYWPELGLTLDTIEDLRFLKEIIKNLNYLNFKLYDIITLLKIKPELLEINKSVKRNIPGVE